MQRLGSIRDFGFAESMRGIAVYWMPFVNARWPWAIRTRGSTHFSMPYMFENLFVTIGLLTLLWLVSVVKRDASIVDPFWGLGFVILGWITLWQRPPDVDPGLVPLTLLMMTTVWGLRLSVYLAWRNWGEGEDRRYAAMRNNNPAWFPVTSLFKVFWLQAVILWFVALPIQAGIAADVSRGQITSVLVAPGVILWLVGLLFETVGDYQLARFKSIPANRGKVLATGLWAYTRHPNYFGDFCVCWGIYFVAVFNGAWWTIASPLLMSFFLLKVSGVQLLEKDMDERRPEYAAYRQQTNAFFPGRPKSL